MARWTRLGLIAGGGELPVQVAQACAAEGRLGAVIALKGFADPARFETASQIGVGQLGAATKALRAAKCDAVCLAGIVTRPDFTALKPDWEGAKLLPKVLKAAVKGDDALLRVIVGYFEQAGFAVVGAHEIAAPLLAQAGPLGAIQPDDGQMADAIKAFDVAGQIGALDIGQGAVVCDGLVLAVEAQEGTDGVLARVATLPEEIRGRPGAPRGVLAKRPKPGQETRVDLPVIGVSTVEAAAKAGLAGIAVPAGGALILGKRAVAEAADRAGLFVVGLERGKAAR